MTGRREEQAVRVETPDAPVRPAAGLEAAALSQPEARSAAAAVSAPAARERAAPSELAAASDRAAPSEPAAAAAASDRAARREWVARSPLEGGAAALERWQQVAEAAARAPWRPVA